MRTLHGVIPAVLTPFHDGAIDVDTVRRHVDFMIDGGVHGLYPCGTTGEGILLTTEERKTMAQAVVEAAEDRVPVMVHVGAASTDETIDLALHARDIGADAIGVVSPFFYSVDKAGMTEHFRSVACAVDNMPMYLYNIPGNAKNDITPDIVAAVAAECPNVVGIKDSSKDIARLAAYALKMGSDFSVIVGSDALLVPALTVGACGVISAIANSFPREVVAAYEAFMAGNTQEAMALQAKLSRLRQVLKNGPYLGAYKAALRLKNVDFRGAKAPMREMDEADVARLRHELTQLGVL
jgi:4-hydroxy-tetrahydrodipicolinate synthase